MQHNEPGFGIAFEQLRRTPDNHEKVGNAFSRATGGSPVWANVGYQLAKDSSRATELLGFTNEAAATHAEDPEATDLFNHYQREIGDAMHAYAQSGNAEALHHAADQMNDLFVHHLSSPLLGKAAVATYMTDEELANYQTGIEASAFATPEMVGAWYNPKSWGKKKTAAADAAAGEKAAADAAEGKSEKKGNVFSQAWRGTKRAVASVVTSGKKKVQQKKSAAAQALAQKIIEKMDVDSTLSILKNSRGDSASLVYAIAGNIRSLTGATSDDDHAIITKLFGEIPAWRLPVQSGFEGLGELGEGFTAVWKIGVKDDFEKDSSKGVTWTMVDDARSSPVDLLGFGSAAKLGHPKAQIFIWAYEDADAPKFTWKASAPISIQAVFTQETSVFSTMKRFDFSAVMKAQNNLGSLGTTTKPVPIRNSIWETEGYKDFEKDLDEYQALPVKVPGRKDSVSMFKGVQSPAYTMWKNGSLFVFDLVQNLLQRSAALTPRCRFYCKVEKVPKSWSATTEIEVKILAVTLEIQVQSIALGYEIVKHYKENYPARMKAGGYSSATTAAAGSSSSTEVGVADQ